MKASVEFIWDGILSVAVAARKFLAQLKFKQLKFHSYRLWSQDGKIPKPRAFRFRDFTFIRNKKGR